RAQSQRDRRGRAGAGARARPVRPTPGALARLKPKPTDNAEPLRGALELSGALHRATRNETQVGFGLAASWLWVTAPLAVDARLRAEELTDMVVTSPRHHVRVSETFASAGVGVRSAGTLQLGAKLG